MNIIDKPVAIVIHSITSNFAAVSPNVVTQSRMRIVNSCVDYCDDYLIATRCNLPCGSGVNIGIDRPASLPFVFKPPQGINMRIRVVKLVGRDLHNVIKLSVDNTRSVVQVRHNQLRVGVSWQFHLI